MFTAIHSTNTYRQDKLGKFNTLEQAIERCNEVEAPHYLLVSQLVKNTDNCWCELPLDHLHTVWHKADGQAEFLGAK